MFGREIEAIESMLNNNGFDVTIFSREKEKSEFDVIAVHKIAATLDIYKIRVRRKSIPREKDYFEVISFEKVEANAFKIFDMLRRSASSEKILFESKSDI
jgi:hypothetical protein